MKKQTNSQKLKSSIDQYAIMESQKNDLHELCISLNWPKELEKAYFKLQKEGKKFCNNNLKEVLLNVSISGVNSNEEVSHYDMDDSLRKKFGKRISCDSESGQFFAHCSPKDKKKIVAYIKKKYPKKEFNPRVTKDKYVSYFVNSYHVKEYVKENGLLASLDSVVDKSKIQAAQKIKEKIENKKKEIDALSLDMQNLFGGSTRGK